MATRSWVSKAVTTSAGALLATSALMLALLPGTAGAAPSPTFSSTQPDAVTGDNPTMTIDHPQSSCQQKQCYVPDPNSAPPANNPAVDTYTHDIYERPINHNQDVFYPALDIVSSAAGSDGEYLYFRINLFGIDTPQKPLPFFYKFELYFDGDPRGGIIVSAKDPSTNLGNSFGSDGVIAFWDQNRGLGDARPNQPDGPAGIDGYEVLAFDQGTNKISGSPGGGDAIQARVVGDRSVEFAVELALLRAIIPGRDPISEASFRAYATKGDTDPTTFYLHDKFGRNDSGSPYPWLATTGAPNNCVNDNDALSGAERASLDSGTNQDNSNFNPCWPTRDIYEIDNGVWITIPVTPGPPPTTPPPTTPPPPGQPAIDIVKSGPQQAQVGDTITYKLKVSIPIDRPLHDVTVTDPKCDAAPTLQSKTGGDQDDILEFGEVWTYTCPHRITASDPNPLPNTSTATGIDDAGAQVQDQDSHLVEIVAEPRIRIIKDGPQQAKVGDTIIYVLEVSIPVDRPLHDVRVTDPVCDEPPDLKSKSGGDNDNILELGEVWTYTCPHKATLADVGTLDNTAVAAGEDVAGKRVTDRDSHVVNISQVKPQRPITPTPPIVGPLPFTGFEPHDIVFVALALLVSGTAALWVTRRQERRRS